MKRFCIAFLILALALAAWVWFRRPAPEPTSAPAAERVATGVVVTVSPSAAPPVAPGAALPLVGERILRDYANPAGPPENDLTLMSQLMENFQLLVKDAATRPLSANGDWASALRGRNAAHERFLPDRHIAFNTQGQLVDRWGTPLFFHAVGAGRIEVRSAGPDRQLWTADDIHRNADGSFRHGTNLNPLSLLLPPKRN